MNFLSRLAGRKPAPPPLEAGRPAIDPAAAAAGLMQRAVFVSGRGRSGSSLLLRLIDGHPEVYVIPRESRLLTEIGPKLAADGDKAATEAYLLDRFADFRAGEHRQAAAALI